MQYPETVVDLYVDTQNLAKSTENKDVINFWSLLNHHNPSVINNIPYKSLVLHLYGNCKQNDLSVYQMNFYSEHNASGKLVLSLDTKNKFQQQSVVPGTGPDLARNYICNLPIATVK